MAHSPAAFAGIFAFMLMATLGGSSEDVGLMPKFVEDVPNITVTVGRDALLPCTVEQLRGYKVAWVQVDTQTILTIHKQVITRNPRVALLHNDHRTWHLQIKSVKEIDRGWYMCQVNTDPMRSRQGYVDVVVPPDIIDRESSGDLTVREGQDVTLTCRAKGHPQPIIVWRREDNQDILPDLGKTGRTSVGVNMLSVGVNMLSVGVNRRGVGGSTRVVEGETLVLKKVSRLQMGSYLCIASNGIPPSISKRAHLRVQFPPMAWVPHQLEGAYVGQDLTIECQTEAFPRSINYWTNSRGDMVVAGERFEPVLAETVYKVYMKLRIRGITKEDFGTFRCVAKNSLGETDGAIRIYEIDPPKSQVNGDSEDEEEDLGTSGEASTTIIIPTSVKDRIINKSEEWQERITEASLDIIALTETKLTEVITDVIFQSGYQILREDRRNRGKGVTLLIKNRWSFEEMEGLVKVVDDYTITRNIKISFIRRGLTTLQTSSTRARLLGQKVWDRPSCLGRLSGPDIMSLALAYLSGPDIMSLALAYLSGPDIMSLALAYLSGPDIMSLALAYLSGPDIMSLALATIWP
ncbi:neurotrimin-like [Cherax quadricarinatus]|uniref:neurotrimin-like n=1 Tax=Cherax quadricarinatus TaxID=27406 RepID=UPI00387E315A